MNKVQTKDQQTSEWVFWLLAFSCGIIVANLYYAQPLIGPISNDIQLSRSAAGLIVTLTQIGYVVGLLFIVPLCDLIENRRLVFSTLLIVISALVVGAFTSNAIFFLLTTIFIGLGSVATQILVPYAAHLAKEKQRGQVVGNVMSGLLLGIMLARPVASLITSLWGWQTVFLLSGAITTLLTLLLTFLLPKRTPSPTMNYKRLIYSLWLILQTKEVLRRRAFYQACLFGSFSLFWTVTPLWLTDHFHLSQQGIALFAFAGVAGAIAAPIAGRLADKGWTRPLTGLAISTAILAFLLTFLFENSSSIALTTLVIAAIILDMAVSGNLVLGQRAIYSLGDAIRGRVNGIFMALFFSGGAAGSALGSWAYAYGGWTFASTIGLSLSGIALLYYFTEKTNQ